MKTTKTCGDKTRPAHTLNWFELMPRMPFPNSMLKINVNKLSSLNKIELNCSQGSGGERKGVDFIPAFCCFPGLQI